MRFFIFFLFVFFGLFFLLGGCSPAVSSPAPLLVAVSANAQFALREVEGVFEKQTGIAVDLVVSSSGKLTAQIENGAPFAVFLSADLKYPQKLFESGKTRGGCPRVYTQGSLVLWSCIEGEGVKESLDLEILKQERIQRIALGNPQLAPYGSATLEVLHQRGLYDKVKDKLIYGESLAQVNQYITLRSVDLGFTAKSVVCSPEFQGQGSWVEVDSQAYAPLLQGVVLLKGDLRPEAQVFYDFLFTEVAQKIFKAYGYLVLGDEKSEK